MIYNYLYKLQWTPTVYVVKDGKVVGAIDEYGIEFSVNAAILTTGTSLDGKIWIGLNSYSAGRLGEKAAYGLSDSLRKLGIELKLFLMAADMKDIGNKNERTAQNGNERFTS